MKLPVLILALSLFSAPALAADEGYGDFGQNNEAGSNYGDDTTPLPDSTAPQVNKQEPEAADSPAITPNSQEPDAAPGNDDSSKIEAVTPPLPAAAADAAATGEATEAAAPAKFQPMKFAKLQGLNKVTARTSEIKAEINKTVKFGNLEVIVEKCLAKKGDEKVENTGLITIWAEIPGEKRSQVFHGWMFSSSPALSALEHPIYDIILQDCNNGEEPKAEPKAEEKKDDKKAPAKDKAKPVAKE